EIGEGDRPAERGTATAAEFYPAGWDARGGVAPPRTDGVPPGGTRCRVADARRAGQPSGANLPEPPIGLPVRAGSRRERRREGGRAVRAGGRAGRVGNVRVG